MALLKEDGSLDIERINNLPLEEYMEEVGNLTQEQYREYVSKLPINESKECTQAVEVNFGFDDKRSGVDAKDFMNKLRKRRNPM